MKPLILPSFPPCLFLPLHPAHIPVWGRGDARPGRMACWKSLKYMRVPANTLLNHGVSPPTLVYLNSEQARSPPSQSFVCVTDEPLMAGLPRRCALCISLLRAPHTEGSVRPRNTNSQHPHTPRTRGWGLCGGQSAGDSGMRGWGGAHRGRRPSRGGPGGGGIGEGWGKCRGLDRLESPSLR